MGKIYKFSNIYDTDGNIICKGPQTNYSIKELEELVDKLGKDKDEQGNVIKKLQYSNATIVLAQMYSNPKTEEDKAYVKELQNNLIEKLQATAKKNATKQDDVKRALGEVNNDVKLAA